MKVKIDMKKISVIVPVYKAEKYLKRCVDSIRQQAYTNLEIILVDDGSPDQCPALCDEFALLDERIKVIHKQNEGVAAARNTGLDMAEGEYLTFVDSDDYIEPVMYSEMMEQAEKFSCDLVMCDCLKEFSDCSEVYTHEIRPGYYGKKELQTEYYSHLLMKENVEYPPTISNCLLLFKRKLLNRSTDGKELRYVSGIRFSEDLLFGAQLMRQADSFFYMKGRAFYHYYMNPCSATHTYAPDKWDNYCRLHREIRNCFLGDTAFDFKRQVDLCLLFFLYNAIGDIRGTETIPQREKKKKILDILNDRKVKSVFRRIHVLKLPISWKLKVITLCYKYRIGIQLLIKYLR